MILFGSKGAILHRLCVFLALCKSYIGGAEARTALLSKDIFHSVRDMARSYAAKQKIEQSYIQSVVTRDSFPPIILAPGPSSPQRQPYSQN